MEEKDRCMCEPTEIFIFACSGGSNVGQISNQAAIDLTKKNLGKLFCLAGIGGHVSGIIESTRAAKKLVAIDGCPVRCALKTLNHAGFKPDIHLVITELGIDKCPDLDVKRDDCSTVVKKITDCLGV